MKRLERSNVTRRRPETLNQVQRPIGAGNVEAGNVEAGNVEAGNQGISEFGNFEIGS